MYVLNFFLKLIQVGKDAKSTKRHKSEKMAPTDNVRYTASCMVKRKKNCGNCGVARHTKAECAETEWERPKEKSRKGAVSSADLMNILNL
jgi:hypothetical protein